MKVIEKFGWVYYMGDDSELDSEKVGKWMYFFNNRKAVQHVCADAVEQGVVVESKHSNNSEGVACFYLNCDDLEGHKKVISYFLENDLIPRTKKGKLYNISFKRDEQTLLNEYGSTFKSEIKLEKFIDLITGEWRITEDEFEAIMPPDVQQYMRWLKKFKHAKELETARIENITYEWCKEAVDTWCFALKYVPEKYRTEEICRSAMRHGAASGKVVEYIPKSLLTLEFIEDLIRVNTALFSSFPIENLRTETVIELALMHPWLLEEIPDSIKDEHFYEMMVKENGKYLRFVPSTLITKKMSEFAIKSQPLAIKYIPSSILNDSLCKMAVSIDWKALRSIPQIFLTDEIFEFAINAHPKSQKGILREKGKTKK